MIEAWLCRGDNPHVVRPVGRQQLVLRTLFAVVVGGSFGGWRRSPAVAELLGRLPAGATQAAFGRQIAVQALSILPRVGVAVPR